MYPAKKISFKHLLGKITGAIEHGFSLKFSTHLKALTGRLSDGNSCFSEKELTTIYNFANRTLLNVVDGKEHPLLRVLDEKETPLLKELSRHQRVVLALLESGMPFDFDYVEYYKRDKQYYTFLDRAILGDDPVIVNLLLDAEIAQDIDLFNKERNNDRKWHPALEFAVSKGNKEIVSRLLEEISAECSEAFFKMFNEKYSHSPAFMSKLQDAKKIFNSQQKLKMAEQDKLHADLPLSFSQLEIQKELGQLPTDPLDAEARKKYHSITENVNDLRLSPTAAEFKPELDSPDRGKENLVIITNQNLENGNNVHAKNQGYFPFSRANNGPVFPYSIPFGVLPTPPCYHPPVFIPSCYPPQPVIFTPLPVAYHPERIFAPHPSGDKKGDKLRKIA